ncbi:MAG: hypothetical protein C0402_05430 [Thermodesulfovibrio sp.]|nr:hypothetical protein [Thermodesulfovibrio sp.]
MFEDSVVLLDEPLEVLKARAGDDINKARWTGDWDNVDPSIKKNYDDVPSSLQSRFRELLATLSDAKAFSYQKFDAALGALRKTCLITLNMGLGKSRIMLMTSLLVNKPTLIAALPRLVRKVWVTELNALGLTDYVVLERPKPSKAVLKKGVKGSVEAHKGYQGIGKVTLRAVSRDPKTTTDACHHARIKIISYNMLLPGNATYDFVICPTCGYKHNQEKCPSIKVDIFNVTLSDADKGFLNRLGAHYRKGKLSEDEVGIQVKERFGQKVRFSIRTCGTALKGSLCPECKKKGINAKLGKGDDKKGYQCHQLISGPGKTRSECGYIARTWVPSITRRLRKRIQMIGLDESQCVKNRSALRSKYALSIRPEYRYLISGTPATANIAFDLYYQLEWLLGKGVMFPYTGIKDFASGISSRSSSTVQVLHQLLDAVQIRREADEYGVAADVELPPVKERRFSITMSAAERENYEAASKDILAWYMQHHEDASELDFFSKMWILRRAACVPWVDNPTVTASTKIEALKLEVQLYLSQGRKILIGTEMLDMLDAIEKAIPGCVRIDGSVDIKHADRLIALFQDVCPECNIPLDEEFGTMVCPACEKKYETPKVMAVSRMAVREGVTLNKASVVVLTDASWTYADLWQFWKRAHRIGCTYDFLDVLYMEAPDTIEEQMYNIVEARKQLIFQAINRKTVAQSEKINIKDFVRQLMALTVSRPVEVNL